MNELHLPAGTPLLLEVTSGDVIHSFWLLHFGFLAGAAPDTGWFSYAPLTEAPYTRRPSVDYWILGLLVTSFGTIATGLNLIITVVKMRAPGMSPRRIPVCV